MGRQSSLHPHSQPCSRGRSSGLKTPVLPGTTPWALLHARPVRGQPFGPGGPHAHSAGASLPGVSSGPSQSAAAALHSRCWRSPFSGTWGLLSHCLWGEGAEGRSVNVPAHVPWRGQLQTQEFGASGSAHLLRQPQRAEEPRELPLPSSWRDQSTLRLGYGLQPVGWQQRPEQASHWEAFPVYEWLPLG